MFGGAAFAVLVQELELVPRPSRLALDVVRGTPASFRLGLTVPKTLVVGAEAVVVALVAQVRDAAAVLGASVCFGVERYAGGE